MATSVETSASALVIELRNDRQIVASWRDVLFGIWLQRGTAEDIREGYTATHRLLSRHAEKVAALSVVHPTAMGPVDAEGRAVLAENNRLIHPRSKAGALAILAGGFSGAMVRSISTGLNLISPPGHPNKVFDSVERACAFLAPYLDPIDGRAATVEDLVTVFRTFPTQ